jgi:tRNA-dihydrouridine synthase C
MRIVLAPMEGLADVHLRRLLTAQGGYDWVVSEFVRVVDRLYPSRVFYRICPELMNGGHTDSGTPVRVQLLGSDLNAMADNAAKAIELGSFGIDINFGCPSKTVNRRQGGAVLLKEPDMLHRVVEAVRAAVPANIMVSAKMRLGFEDQSLMLANASALESGGAGEITVHARTREQGYKPPVYWYALGRIREHIRVPLIANGDIVDLKSYQQCCEESGTVDVMIGRGAVRQPDLAQVIRHQLPEQDWSYIEGLLGGFWSEISQFMSPRDRIGRIKQWLNYLRQRHPEASALWQPIRLEKDVNRISELLLGASQSKFVA